MNATEFARGMTVYSHDDIELGEVVEVWAETPSHGALPASRYHQQDYGPIKGTTELFTTEQGWLQVRQGAFLGSGGRDLYVPLWAVQHIDSLVSATLQHQESRCEVEFSRPELVPDKVA
jgi:hypothetical protein